MSTRRKITNICIFLRGRHEIQIVGLHIGERALLRLQNRRDETFLLCKVVKVAQIFCYY